MWFLTEAGDGISARHSGYVVSITYLPIPFLAGSFRSMEGSMNSIIRLVTLVAGLILLLNVTPSWGPAGLCLSRL